jgi:alkaline phosphatase D
VAVKPISRRAFLAGSAAAVVAACAGDDDGASSESTSRPSATTESSAPRSTTEPPATSPAAPTTTAATASAAPTTAAAAPEYPGTADPFTLGVASGDPALDSVVLWTRLVPVGEVLPGPVGVRVEVARDDTFADVVHTTEIEATPDDAHSLHVEVGGLEPDAWYSYRFVTGPFTSAIGRTRTMPADRAMPGQIVLGSASCQNYEDGWYVAHRDIAGAGLDVLVWLGDYIYEGAGQPVGVDGSVRTHGTPEATTLDDYRARYALYKADPDLQAAHAACPWLVVWDDHEVQNNYAGDVSADTSVPADAFRARRAAAYRAWWEHMPVRLGRPESADVRMYRAFKFGALVDLSLLDTRQYRSDQTCGDVTMRLEPPCPETLDPARTMLGAEQEVWLTERLRATRSRWNALGQQVVVGNTTLNGAVLNFDQWDGYPAARDRLLQQVVDAQVPNVVVLTGDIHLAGVGSLRAPGGGAVIGSELVATSISSGGNVNPALAPLVAALPDLVDVELAHRGWIKHTVTPDRWRAEYRIVDDARVADSSVGAFGTYEIVADTPGVVKVS